MKNQNTQVEYKGYIIVTEGRMSSICDTNGKVLGMTWSDDDAHFGSSKFNSEKKAKKRIDIGVINLAQATRDGRITLQEMYDLHKR